MKCRPLQGRVVLSRLEGDIKNVGGIFIPCSANEKPMRGEVVAVAPGVRDESATI